MPTIWEEKLGDDQNKELPVATAEFVKESFEKILALHEEILDAKTAQIEQLKDENSFLKESLLGVQKLYSEDRELIQLLKKEIFDLQEELEFTRRKYKMMWNQAIENYSKRS